MPFRAPGYHLTVSFEHASDGPGEGRLHIGVTPWREEGDGPGDSLPSQGELAESLGFDSLWLPESHFIAGWANPAPLLRLAAVAARTKTLGLGTTSLLLPMRHPVQVAEEVAVLDRLSGGRVILGVGRGFRPALFRVFGVAPREKRQRFEAALEVMRTAWRGEPVAWEEGEKGTDAQPIHVTPTPLQRPHPPLWVAAFGPKAVTQAGRLGLPYLASPVEPLEILADNYERHRNALPPGRSWAGMAVPVMRTAFVSQDPAQLERARRALSAQGQALARSSLRSLRRAASSPVAERALVGSPQDVLAGVARYRETLGLTHLILRTHVPGLEPELLVESLTLLAQMNLPGRSRQT